MKPMQYRKAAEHAIAWRRHTMTWKTVSPTVLQGTCTRCGRTATFDTAAIKGGIAGDAWTHNCSEQR